MVNRPQRFEGDFVESADLMRCPPVTKTIKAVVKPGSEKCANKRVIDRPIIEFEGSSKRFICSKTNERLIKAIYGPKTSEWAGKQVTLMVRYLIEAFGEPDVPTLRIVLPRGIPMPFSVRKWYGSEKPRGVSSS